MSLPAVALIGRPNTGKSTLFNTLVGKRKSIISEVSGTTRDAIVEKKSGEKLDYMLVDTAGLTNASGEPLEETIQTQAQVALENADLLLFLVDAKAELTQDDFWVAEKLRKGKKPFLFLANKIDDGNATKGFEVMSLGLGEPMIISGKNFFGIWDLEEAIESALLDQNFPEKTPESSEEEEPFDENQSPDIKSETIKLAFIGRPNVGKSSLMNALCGQQKSIVSEVSGTTRDVLDLEMTSATGQKFKIIDTAGMRRPGKIGKGIEYWASVRTNLAIEESDICCLMIDALDGVTHQDLHILGLALKANKGIILGINKFDLVREKSRGEESDEREVSENKNVGGVARKN